MAGLPRRVCEVCDVVSGYGEIVFVLFDTNEHYHVRLIASSSLSLCVNASCKSIHFLFNKTDSYLRAFQ